MLNNKIVNFIKSELTKGTSREKIMNSLVKAGWQSNVISKAFNAISIPASTIKTSPQSTNRIATEKECPITQLWVFKGTIILTAILLVAIIFGYYFPYYINALPFCLIAIILAIPFNLIANILFKANFHYSTKDKFFVVKQGVFSKKQRNLPYGVIQNVLVKQDWLDRVFGLASFSIENASQGGGGGKGFFLLYKSYKDQGETIGSSSNKVNIPGLKKKDAEALRLVLLQRMKENPIEDSQSGL